MKDYDRLKLDAFQIDTGAYQIKSQQYDPMHRTPVGPHNLSIFLFQHNEEHNCKVKSGEIVNTSSEKTLNIVNFQQCKCVPM